VFEGWHPGIWLSIKMYSHQQPSFLTLLLLNRSHLFPSKKAKIVSMLFTYYNFLHCRYVTLYRFIQLLVCTIFFAQQEIMSVTITRPKASHISTNYTNKKSETWLIPQVCFMKHYFQSSKTNVHPFMFDLQFFTWLNSPPVEFSKFGPRYYWKGEKLQIVISIQNNLLKLKKKVIRT